MKFKVDVILPIALALILPGLNLFSNPEITGSYPFEFYRKWFFASVVLYCLWYILIFASTRKSKYDRLLIGTAICLSTVAIYLVFSLTVFKTNDHIKWVFIAKFLSASILFLIIQYALRASKKLVQMRLEKEQIQSENYKAQLQELRLKVDPHFLFNSLNTLRIMIRSENKQSEDFVMNLSNFYRQTLTLTHSPTIALKDELEVLKAYLFLMEKRNEGKLKITYRVNEAWMHYQIPTLSLQLLAENVFKHNLSSASKPLEIWIDSVPEFYIAVRNKLQPKFARFESSGYGLDNIRQRYELLGIQEGISIEETTTYFEVRLKLI